LPCISKNAETMCYRSSSIPFILLALSLLAVSCGSRSGHTGQMPPMEIEIAVAEFDLLYTRRSFISQINSDNEVVVEPRVSGFLVARHYKKGMPVRKGQLIFEIDDSEYYTALLSAQAALESSRALALEAKNNSTGRCRWPRSMPSAVRNSTNIRRSTPLRRPT
jgi:multidrug efflux pump subunit AcrA (membrane-fusion protein)